MRQPWGLGRRVCALVLGKQEHGSLIQVKWLFLVSYFMKYRKGRLFKNVFMCMCMQVHVEASRGR